MRVMVVLLLFATLPCHAEALTPEDLFAWHAYNLAVAEAPGDAHTDLLLAKAMPMFVQTSDSDEAHAFNARAEVVAARLQARVDAERDSDPVLLAADLGCWPDPKSQVCTERRAKLEAFAAGNAYYGLILMTTAWAAGDAEGYLRTARLAATAERYDSQGALPFGALRDRYRSVPLPALGSQDERARRLGPEISAMAMTAALAFPSLQHFSQPCRESEGELRQHCLAVAKAMITQSHLLIEIWIAKTVIDAIGTAEDIEGARMIQREAHWLQSRSTPLATASEWGDVAGMDDYFNAYANEGELSAMRALLAAHGIPLTPPDHWTPD